jgi:hypothetical protein
MLKLPSVLDVVPIDVPLTFTDTPASGEPPASITLPVMFLFCASKKLPDNKRTMSKDSFDFPIVSFLKLKLRLQKYRVNDFLTKQKSHPECCMAFLKINVNYLPSVF